VRTVIAVLWLLIAASAPRAENEPAGQFDYYLLVLSWSPSWCRLEGDDRHAPECRQGAGLGFTLHGLWPQGESGWPSYCRTGERDPGRSQTAAMADIMGSAGLAWYQWKKHGRCSGLSAERYFALARQAYERINRPKLLRAIPHPVRIAPGVVEAAFLEANPQLSPDSVTVTCRGGLLQEVRICLDRSLQPRPCSASVARDCPAPAIALDPPR